MSKKCKNCFEVVKKECPEEICPLELPASCINVVDEYSCLNWEGGKLKDLLDILVPLACENSGEIIFYFYTRSIHWLTTR